MIVESDKAIENECFHTLGCSQLRTCSEGHWRGSMDAMRSLIWTRKVPPFFGRVDAANVVATIITPIRSISAKAEEGLLPA